MTLSSYHGRRAAFFDRDGTLNVDTGYPWQLSDLQLVPKVASLVRKHNDLDDLVIVVSNQSGIARGVFTQKDLDCFNKALEVALFQECGAKIDAFYVCPHYPEITGPCECRKPLPGLYLQAAAEFDINLQDSIAYGDREVDYLASKAAGVGHFVYINDALA